MNIEICSCSGGMALGFKRAGVTFDLVVDKDPNAVASYTHNIGHRPIQMDVHDFLRMVRSGWRPSGPVGLFVADPPCTPWSRAGKREGLADERDCMRTTVELISLLRPRAYLIGNVPGLQYSTSWPVLQKLLAPLAQHGYCVRDYVSLDAADYGVPQHRVRPFWFGHLDGPCVTWPAPTHGAWGGQMAIAGAELLPWVTCRQALGHLSADELGRAVRLRWKNGQDHRPSGPDESAKSLTTNTNSDVLLANGKHPVNTLDEPSMTVTAKGDGRGAQGACVLSTSRPRAQGLRTGSADRVSDTVTAKPSRVGAGGAHVLDWPWDRPSTTIQGDERLSAAGHHDPSVPNSQHGPNAIVLSESAAAILQGFPEGWLFHGETKKARWSQIGQAIPPPLAHAVARAVAEQMRAAMELAA